MIPCGAQYVRVPSLQRALQTLFTWRNASCCSLSPVSSRRMYSRGNCVLTLSSTPAALSVQGTLCKYSHTHAVPAVDLDMPPKSKKKKSTKLNQRSETLKKVSESSITQLEAAIQKTVVQCPDSEVVGKSELPEAGMESEENQPKKRKKRTVKVKKEEEEENLPVYFPFEGDGVSTSADIIQVGTSETNDKQHEELFEIKQIERPEGRFYLISCDKGVCELPSVTTVLKSTVPKVNSFRLYNWTKSMIKQHGKSGYKKIRREIVRKGRSFHQQLESKLLEEQSDSQTKEPFLENLGENSGYFQSIHHVLQDVTDIHALESVAVHAKLGYTGTFDCVAKYKDELCVIDWKTSLKPKPSLADCFDFPLQAAAYAGAVNQDPHYPIKVFNALIVIAYPNGEPAHAHFIPHEQSLQYWARWLARLEEYRTMFAHDLSEVYS